MILPHKHQTSVSNMEEMVNIKAKTDFDFSPFSIHSYTLIIKPIAWKKSLLLEELVLSDHTSAEGSWMSEMKSYVSIIFLPETKQIFTSFRRIHALLSCFMTSLSLSGHKLMRYIISLVQPHRSTIRKIQSRPTRLPSWELWICWNLPPK